TQDVNILKEDVGNVPIWVKRHDVPITAFSEDGLSVIATKLGTPLIDSYTSDMYMESWGRSSYARVMIELQIDVVLKDTLVVVVPKLVGEGFLCILFVLSMSGNIQGVQVARQDVSNSNTFDVLNSIENDDDLGTNERNSKFLGKGANSDVISSAHGTSSKAVDDDGKPINKVDSSVNADSDGEVDEALNETSGFMASTSLESSSVQIVEDDYDPYDDDMYSHHISEDLQAIYHDWDIKVHGLRKK
ncbi:hypothetical protein Tco_0994116, partial [Tanacetum coccineum]